MPQIKELVCVLYTGGNGERVSVSCSFLGVFVGVRVLRGALSKVNNERNVQLV